MQSAERGAIIGKLTLSAATDRTLTTVGALTADLARAERRGYASTEGENVANVIFIACPVGIEGVSCAVAVAGPIGCMAPRATQLADLVQGVIQRIR